MNEKHDGLFFGSLIGAFIGSVGLVFFSTSPAVTLALLLGVVCSTLILGYMAGIDND